MAQSHLALRPLAARQGKDIRAARCGGFFPLIPALSLGELVITHKTYCRTPGPFWLHGKTAALLSRRDKREKPSVSTLGLTLKGRESRRDDRGPIPHPILQPSLRDLCAMRDISL